MKIICFTSSLTVSTTFIYHQLQAMEASNVEVKLLIQRDECKQNYNLDYTLLPQENKIENFFSKLINKASLSFSYFNFKLEKIFIDQVRKFNPDLVLVHFGIDLIKLYPYLANFRFPVVTIFHGFDASRLLRNLHYCRKLKKIFSNDRFYASCVAYDMISRFNVRGISTKNFSYHHLGVDLCFFNPCSGKPRNTRDYLQISNFVPKKGHETTVRSFNKFIMKYKDNESKLIFAGRGYCLDIIKNLVSELELQNRVIFLGDVNMLRVKELMQEYKYFVHHSVTDITGDQEGIPTVLMESLAMNQSIISTFHSGIPELIGPNEGILTKEFDEEAMCDAFYTIKSIELAPRRKIETNFDIQTNTKKFLNYLCNLVN